MKLFNRNKDSDEEEAVEMVPQEQEEPTKEKGRGPSVHYGDEG